MEWVYNKLEFNSNFITLGPVKKIRVSNLSTGPYFSRNRRYSSVTCTKNKERKWLTTALKQVGKDMGYVWSPSCKLCALDSWLLVCLWACFCLWYQKIVYHATKCLQNKVTYVLNELLIFFYWVAECTQSSVCRYLIILTAWCKICNPIAISL